ncbi:hypothetical protein BH20ACI1_BH20ACI1_06870 [soil metagenome]
MILDTVESVDGVPIRLTDERWYDHIIENHPELSGHYENVLSVVESPTFVLRGRKKTKVAVANFGRKKWLHVVYREISRKDGFILSAYFKKDYDESLIIWESN